MPLGESALGMGVEPRVVHTLHGGMSLQEAREGEGIRGLPLHAHAQGPRPARGEPRVEGTQVRPRADHGGPHAIHGCLAPQHDAARDISVARDELGQAVHHDGRSVLERAHHRGRRQRGIDDEVDAACGERRGDRLQVDHAQEGIRERLDEDGARVRPERSQQEGGIGGIDEDGVDAEPAPLVVEKCRGGAVEIARGHDVVARGEEPEEERRGRAHARRAGDGGLGSFEARHEVLEHGMVGGSVAAVDEAGCLPLPDRLDRVHVLEDVHVGLVDRRREGSAGRRDVTAPARGPGLEVHGGGS